MRDFYLWTRQFTSPFGAKEQTGMGQEIQEYKKRRLYLRLIISHITNLLVLLALTGCTNMAYLKNMMGTSSSASSEFISPSQANVPDETISKMRTDIPEIKGRALTLSYCIRIALERNPRTRMAWQNVQSAAARVGEERAAYLPLARLTLGAVREHSDPLFSSWYRENILYNIRFRASYLLFDGGARSARVTGIKAELLSTNFQHNAILQEVALAVEETYYELLAAKWAMNVAQETVKQTQYHVDLARARHESGLVARSDVLKAETEKADADLVLVKARSAVEIEHGRLASIMGLKVSQPFEVAENLEVDRKQELGNIEKLLDEAGEVRPELQSALAQIEIEGTNVKAAQSQYWPNINMNIGYGWRNYALEWDQDEWSVGIGIDLPLFTGLDRAYQIQRAKSDLARANAEYENLLRDVELEVWVAYSRVTEADQTIQAAEKLVSSAEENNRVAEGEYKNGIGSIIELIDAQTSLTTARNHLVQSRLAWYIAKARLERALGQTLEEIGKENSERKGK